MLSFNKRKRSSKLSTNTTGLNLHVLLKCILAWRSILFFKSALVCFGPFFPLFFRERLDDTTLYFSLVNTSKKHMLIFEHCQLFRVLIISFIAKPFRRGLLNHSFCSMVHQFQLYTSSSPCQHSPVMCYTDLHDDNSTLVKSLYPCISTKNRVPTRVIGP